LALLFLVALPSSAHAAFAPSCLYEATDLPCFAEDNDNETSVESSLWAVFGEFIDVMFVDKADDMPTESNPTVNGSNGLSVTADTFKDGEGISGSFSYDGPYEIAYVTVKAGTGYVLYDYAELVQDGVNTWTTELLGSKGLSHLSIWAVAKASEPGTLGLFLMGVTFLAWRRGRRAKTAC
jgi:hypothetical protein